MEVARYKKQIAKLIKSGIEKTLSVSGLNSAKSDGCYHDWEMLYSDQDGYPTYYKCKKCGYETFADWRSQLPETGIKI